MGNSTNSHIQVLQPLDQQWITEKEQSYCTILKNIQTSKHLEQYVVNTSKSISQQLDIYEYRYHQRANLVSTISVQKKSSKLCNNNAQLIVTNQRIPKRLSELKNLKLQQSISILYSTLIGFKTIFNKTGYCEISNKMIGFNEDNVTKIWINQNFAKNYPEDFEYEYQKSSSSILQMVTTILNIISQHSTLQFGDISNYIQKSVIINQSFEEALTSVQTYIKMKFIKLPHKLTLQSHQELYKKQKNPSSTIVQTQTTSRSKNMSVSNSQVFGLKTNKSNLMNILRQPNNYKQYYYNHKNTFLSPTKVLNKVKSDSNLYQTFNTSHYLKPTQTKQPYQINHFKHFIKTNNSTNHIIVKSPSTLNLNNTTTLIKQQHCIVPNKTFQTDSVQFNSQNSIHKSPYNRLKTIQSSNASVSMTNSKFQSPVFKLIPRTTKPSQFSNQRQYDPFQQIGISQIKQMPLQDKSNNSSLQTTGQFKQLHIIEDLSEQVSSHRIRPFIPPLDLNQDEQQIDNEMIQSLRNDLYLNQFQRPNVVQHEQQMNKILTTVEQQEQTSRRSPRIPTLNKISDRQNILNSKDNKVNKQKRGLLNLSPIDNLILNSYKSPFKQNIHNLSKNTALYL